MSERRLHFWNDHDWREIVAGWPEAVRRGFAKRLRAVQFGEQPHSQAKPLSGFDIPIWEMWHRDGQRVIYSVHYAAVTGRIDVLDAFEKDSRAGKKMRTSDKTRIKGRIASLKREMEELDKRQRAQRRGLH